MLKKWIMACAALTMCVLPILAGGDAKKGEASYAICLACHGPDGAGNLALNSPAIAGQEEWYLLRQLKYFKEGIRGTDPKDLFGMQMRPMAMTLPDDAAMENVVAYIMTFKPFKPSDHSVKGDIAKGKQTYTTICATCHGANGEGNKTMDSPKLTIQHDWYMVTQLKNFKAGIRGKNPKDIPGMQMQAMSATLADEQAIKDVVAYIMTLGK